MSKEMLGSNVVMTEGEICTSYRQAKDKPMQIGILADLCCTSKEKIVEILREGGCVDDNGNPPRLPGITDADMPDILRARKNGVHLDAIAKRYGVTAPTVSKKIKAYGREHAGEGTVKEGGGKPKEKKDEPKKESADSATSDGSDNTESESSVSCGVGNAVKAATENLEQLRWRRFYESLEIDKDFFDFVLDVYNLLRYTAMMFPGVKMRCEIDNGQVMASGEFQDLLAEYQGGGDPDGKSDA